ncbi:MAG TPA: hypothetical protein VKZ63_08665 [Kofleriaceae bacterium]|nr:hypothetical protein [Kofleriaceae bacterium]
MRLALAAVSACAALAAPGAARAGGNDIVLSRLGEVVVDGGTPVDAVGAPGDFRSLASELGVVLAPRLSAPADTLGFGGFQLTTDVAFTRIHSDRAYWRALRSSPDPSDPTARHGGDYMTTVGFFARKGIWLPAPSFEIGIGAVHLTDSSLWAAQTYAKLALIEGYHELPLPSLALRGAVSRMMGSDQLDLTVASVDATVSKDVGVAGVVKLSPYAGWNWLVIVPRSEVIDRTPHIDPLDDPSDAAMSFAFPDQDDILRHRFFGGLKVQYHVFTIGLEGALALAGGSVDDQAGTEVDCADVTAPTASCDAEDRAGQQASFTITAGLDF